MNFKLHSFNHVIKHLSLVAWLPERCVGVKEAVTKTYPKPPNMSNLLFHTCFRYGNIIIPMALALALFMHSKILPQIF